jgi:hypothetical protein
MENCKKTEIKNLGIYTDAFFNNPQKTLNILDELKRIKNHDYFLDVSPDGTFMSFPIIIEDNKQLLSEIIIDIDKYIDRLDNNFFYQREESGKACIDLVLLTEDFTKVHPPISIHYNAEDDYFFDPRSDENFDYYYEMETQCYNSNTK